MAARGDACAAVFRRSMSRGRWLPVLLLGPVAVWNLAFFIAPVGVMMARSFNRGGAFTLAYYQDLFTSPLYVGVMLTTFDISMLVTAAALLLGYPVAYVLATAGARVRAALLLLVILPYWLDYIVRSYSWMVLLGRMGLVNRTLMDLGLTAEPLSILYTRWSVAVGMVQILLPLMVLTLYAAMLRIDQSLLLAAAAHGARPWQSFWRVFFPLSLPGVYGACLLTFVTSLGFYITPALLGGRKDTMISQLIVTVSSEMLDWSLASAVSVVLLLASLAILVVYNRFFSIDRLWGGSA
jgi:ABC-type spermidine/putrescine transport system permease subunit I